MRQVSCLLEGMDNFLVAEEIHRMLLEGGYEVPMIVLGILKSLDRPTLVRFYGLCLDVGSRGSVLMEIASIKARWDNAYALRQKSGSGCVAGPEDVGRAMPKVEPERFFTLEQSRMLREKRTGDGEGQQLCLFPPVSLAEAFEM